MNRDEEIFAVLSKVEKGELAPDSAEQQLIAMGLSRDKAAQLVGIALGETDLIAVDAPKTSPS